MSPRERELDEELREHVRRLAEQNVAAGMTPAEARRAALNAFGSLEVVRETTREQRRFAWLERLAQDARYGARMLRRSPGFTVAAVLTLGLGIGAATAVFSVVDGVLLRPLPYQQPEQIVQVYEQVARNFFPNRTSDATFAEWREQSHGFQALAQYRARKDSVVGAGEPVQAAVAVVSRDFFRVFQVAPLVGRAFTAAEERDGGEPAALVSHAFWQQRLGGTRALEGQTLTIGARAFPIVGVLPAGFDFPGRSASAATSSLQTEIWLPRGLFPQVASRTAYNWYVVGRLRDGVPLAEAQAEMTTIAGRQRERHGQDTRTTGATLVPLHEDLVGGVRLVLFVLLGAVGLLLCVAIANVANLLLAHATARRQELAVRTALGARRSRLLAQMIVECLLLALGGAAVGVGLAHVGVHTILRFDTGALPRAGEVGVDGRALLFSLAVCGLAALALGLLAAWRATVPTTDVQASLRDGARGTLAAAGGARFRGALVVWQVGLTLTLLSGTGLLGRSLFRLLSTNPGFRTEHVLVMKLARPGPADEAGARRQSERDRQMLERLQAVPGVMEAGAASSFPLDGSPARGGFVVLGAGETIETVAAFQAAAKNPARLGFADFRAASAGYFRALAIPLRRGRMFDDRDGPEAPQAALINEALAKQRWPGEDPIGKRLQYGNMDGDFHPLTVVGIVGDVRTRSLDAAAPATVYVHPLQRPRAAGSLTLVVRAGAAPAAIFAAARSILRELEPAAPPVFSTADDFVAGSVAQRRFLLLLVAVFGLSALALAAIGIYGVTAYSVATRTPEIGVRMALGGRPADVLRLVLAQGLRQVLAGIVLGGLGGLALTRVLRGLLYEIGAADPLTHVAAIGALLIVALAALYVPARRATRIDPMVALRWE